VQRIRAVICAHKKKMYTAHIRARLLEI